MRGQTLIEVLIALAVAVVVVSAVTVTSISSLSNVQFIKDQDQALKYAQEGVEIVRKIRNSDYEGFKLNYNDLYCLGDDQDMKSSSVCDTPNVVGKFIRSVRVNQGLCEDSAPLDTNIAKITVEVFFTSGRCKLGTYCHSSKLISCFSNVNPVAAP